MNSHFSLQCAYTVQKTFSYIKNSPYKAPQKSRACVHAASRKTACIASKTPRLGATRQRPARTLGSLLKPSGKIIILATIGRCLEAAG
jgi:hypothetical protein